MLKSKAEVAKALRRRYDRLWAEEAAGCSDESWPVKIPLGTLSKSEFENDFVEICQRGDELRDAAKALGLGMSCTTKMAGGTKQSLPTHFVAADIEVLATAVKEKKSFACACERAQRLKFDFPRLGAEEIAHLLREMDRVVFEDVDFDLACRAGLWFSKNDATGLTARQVPLEGFHAKWLDASGRRSVVAQLAGVGSLPLEKRPPQVRFTYLDPDYLSSGARRFDSWVGGDALLLPYEPRVVVICENRDSALWFPEVERGIALMGDGFAGINNVAPLKWVNDAPLVVYWGDMDAAGFEILNGYRERGLKCESMLMNMEAFERYERFGTRVDKEGKSLKPKGAFDLPGLNDSERELYELLVDSEWSRVRRIEQERIPLDDALTELERFIGD